MQVQFYRQVETQTQANTNQIENFSSFFMSYLSQVKYDRSAIATFFFISSILSETRKKNTCTKVVQFINSSS